MIGFRSSLRALIEEISAYSSIVPNISCAAERSFDIPANVLSINKIVNATGWKPRPVREALRDMTVAMLRTGSRD